jgi:hypothetical protein
MKVLREGHRYLLENFENKEAIGQQIQFIEKEPVGTVSTLGLPSGEVLQTVFDGTTNEEVLAMLIDRMNYLNKKFPCRENSIAITNLEQALMWLEKRTRDRVARNVEGKAQA